MILAPKIQFSPINENFCPRKHIGNETKEFMMLVGSIFAKSITKGSVNQVCPYSNQLWNTILNYKTTELKYLPSLSKIEKFCGMKMTENACEFK